MRSEQLLSNPAEGARPPPPWSIWRPRPGSMSYILHHFLAFVCSLGDTSISPPFPPLGRLPHRRGTSRGYMALRSTNRVRTTATIRRRERTGRRGAGEEDLEGKAAKRKRLAKWGARARRPADSFVHDCGTRFPFRRCRFLGFFLPLGRDLRRTPHWGFWEWIDIFEHMEFWFFFFSRLCGVQ